VPPNVPDQLPGRLQRLETTENQNAGPVNCIRLFGSANLRCPFLVPPASFVVQSNADPFIRLSPRAAKAGARQMSARLATLSSNVKLVKYLVIT
jgi:hypothetical protein